MTSLVARDVQCRVSIVYIAENFTTQQQYEVLVQGPAPHSVLDKRKVWWSPARMCLLVAGDD